MSLNGQYAMADDLEVESLRTRIAAVQRAHRLTYAETVIPDKRQCECGWRSPEEYTTWTDHPEHVADVLIRELGLQQEFSIGDDDGGRVLWLADEEPVTAREGEVVEHRYITDWIRNE